MRQLVRDQRVAGEIEVGAFVVQGEERLGRAGRISMPP